MATFTGSNDDEVYNGGSEQDDIAGGGGADTLTGGDNDDTIYSDVRSPSWSRPFNGNPFTPPILDRGSEIDIINGGAGRDVIFAGYGDQIYGGTDQDVLLISFMGATVGVTVDFRQAANGATVMAGTTLISGIEAFAWIEGSDFDDDITDSDVSANFAPIYGHGGNDRLVGGYYTGEIHGGAGNDTIDRRGSAYGFQAYGDDGDDTIIGGSGYETLEGGAGNDHISGNSGFDNIDGGDGNDTLDGGGYGDSLFGGSGDDVMYGAGDADIMDGGSGNDVMHGDTSLYATGNYLSPSSNDEFMWGGTGADTIYGDHGNDRIWSGERGTGNSGLNDNGIEKDRIFGGEGDDVISLGYGDDGDGGNGADTLRLSLAGASAGLTLNTGVFLSPSTTLFGGTLKNFETFDYLQTTQFNDAITVATHANLVTIDAGAGDDVVVATGSSVAILGGEGDDRLISGIAGDSFDGGDGFDTIDYRNFASGVTVTLAANIGQAGTGSGGDSFVNVEGINGSAHADTLTGNNEDNALTGGNGDDILRGNGGMDTLWGGLGDDIIYADQSDRIIELFGEGTDRVRVTASYILSQGVNVEIVETVDSDGTTAIDLTGNGLDNMLIGNAGANTLNGLGGTDTLFGGRGNDIYVVDSLDDIITENADGGIDEVRTSISGYALSEHFENLTYTGSSNSSFAGNAGNNVMTGFTGNDSFDLSQGGDDRANGGDGDDAFLFGAAFTLADRVDGGAGSNDRVELGGSYALTLAANNLVGVEVVTLLGGAGNHYAITTVDGNVGAGQTLTFAASGLTAANSFIFNGSAETNGHFQVISGAGDDHLTGGDGDDTINAGDGNDTIIVTPGEDTVDGGAGTDTLIVHMRDMGLIPTLPAGYSFTVTATNVRDESGTIDTDFTGVERIVFSTAVVSGGGTRATGVLYVDGSAATVALTISNMGPYADVLRGGSGNDVFNLNRSAGTIDGGGGNDTVNLVASPAYIYTLTDTGTGGVFVRTNDLAIPYTATLTGIETIVVPGFATNASASAFDGYIFLDSSDSETVNGSRGDDRFRNGPAAGAGGGTDNYRGNGGTDIFDFSGALARIGTKTIGDFDGDDRIDLSSGGIFIGTAAFSGVAGQVRYMAANGQTVIQVDANGDGTADQTITLGSGAYVLGETAVGSAVLQIATPQNVVDGGNGDDDLIGTSGDDLVRGVNGNDTIRATAGTDRADGGDGLDRLVIGVGGSGAFAATATPQSYVFNGTSATNGAIGLSTSTALIETIVLDTTAAGGVGDTIDATSGTVALELLLGSGNDMVMGSTQNDVIDAGAGNDSVNGGTGSDRIYGGDGNDTLRGGLGSDLLDGGAGDDVIYGNSSMSDYFAPSGDNPGNYLYGGSGADTLYGSGFLFSAGRLPDNSGEDDIGTEKDVLVGAGVFSVGVGDDATGTNTTTDTLRLTLAGATSGVDINMAAFNSTLWTVAGGEYRNFDQISTITGSNFADTFTVGNNVTTIVNLYGGDGDDTLILGTGENGGGRILFQAGAGNDTVVFGSNSQNFVNGGEGVDTLDLRLAPSAPFSYAGFEIILGSGAADSFSGGAENNEFYGFGGNDTLSGGGGNDVLEGGDGDDTIYAGEGDDLIVGGAGADQMGGGGGVDSFVYRLITDSTVTASDRLTDFQSGVDRIDLTAFRVGTITIVNSGALATATIETDQGTLRITSDYAFALGDFVLAERAFTGTAGADSFAGDGFDDSFDLSQGGDDTANGGSGNDAFFFGGAFTAADTVNGGDGANDQIGLQGNYSGGLTLGANTIAGIELIGLLGGAGNGYAITTVDANVAAGQVLTLFGTNLAPGNNFTFNGAAETDGSFRIYGGAGTDNLTGGAQNDGFWFGPGRFDPSVDRVNGGGGANDQLALDGDYTITLDGTAVSGIETITLMTGPAGDRNSFDITVTDGQVGAGQQLTLWGLQVVNAIRIDASAELDGSIRVFGGQGADSIYGSAGDDRLFGGAGADFLYGGAGNDTYVYDAVSQSTGVGADGIHLTAGDKIDFNFTVGGIAATVAGGSLTGDFDNDLMTAIGAGQMGVGQAVLFRPDAGIYAGSSFLIVDANGVAGYQAGEDYVIQLIGNPTVLPPDPFV